MTDQQSSPATVAPRSISERARWLLLVLSLVGALGGLGVVNTLHTDRVDQHTRDEFRRVQQQQDEDMCQMLAALLPTAAPTPSSGGYGAAQRGAVQEYRGRRC